MPIYEYRCAACGAELEAIQKMSAAPLETCESCGADALERLISRSSFILKGTGWYVTDYKNAGAPANGEDGAKAKPDSASTGEADKAKGGDASSSSPPSSVAASD